MSVTNNGWNFYNTLCPFIPKVLDKSELIITQQVSFVSQFNVHSNVILFCEIWGSWGQWEQRLWSTEMWVEWTLKMDTAGLCKIFLPIYQTTWFCIPENYNFKFYLHFNLLTCDKPSFAAWYSSFYPNKLQVTFKLTSLTH